MADIVKRLRNVNRFSEAILVMDVAADEIERLRAEAVLSSLSSEIRQLRAEVAAYRHALISFRDSLGGEEDDRG